MKSLRFLHKKLPFWQNYNSIVIPCVVCESLETSTEEFIAKYTQTKKLRPIFMVLYLSNQLRYRNKNKTKTFIKRRTLKNW